MRQGPQGNMVYSHDACKHRVVRCLAGSCHCIAPLDAEDSLKKLVHNRLRLCTADVHCVKRTAQQSLQASPEASSCTMAANSAGATTPLYTAWNCSALPGDSLTASAATMSNFGCICSMMAPAPKLCDLSAS